MATENDTAPRLEMTVNKATQDELCCCAGMARAVADLIDDGQTTSDELARAMAHDLARRLLSVYMSANTPDMRADDPQG